MELYEHAGFVASLFAGNKNESKLVTEVFRQYWTDEERAEIRNQYLSNKAMQQAEKMKLIAELKAQGEEIEPW